MIRIASLIVTLAAVASAQSTKPDPKALEADARARVEAVRTAAKGKTIEPLLDAIAQCGDVPHAISASALGSYLTSGGDDVRKQAAAALGRMTGLPEAAKALHAGMKANESRDAVLTVVFESIEKVQHVSSVAVCREWASSRLAQRDTEEQTLINMALDCLGGLKFKASVEALIDLLHKNEVANGRAGGKGLRARSEGRGVRALRRLTGEEWVFSDEWKDWWEKHAREFNDDLTKKE